MMRLGAAFTRPRIGELTRSPMAANHRPEPGLVGPRLLSPAAKLLIDTLKSEPEIVRPLRSRRRRHAGLPRLWFCSLRDASASLIMLRRK